MRGAAQTSSRVAGRMYGSSCGSGRARSSTSGPVIRRELPVDDLDGRPVVHANEHTSESDMSPGCEENRHSLHLIRAVRGVILG